MTAFGYYFGDEFFQMHVIRTDVVNAMTVPMHVIRENYFIEYH